MDWYILLVQAARMLMRLVCPAFDGELAAVPVTRSGRVFSPRQVEELRRYGGELALHSRSDGSPGGTPSAASLTASLWRLIGSIRKDTERPPRWAIARAPRSANGLCADGRCTPGS